MRKDYTLNKISATALRCCLCWLLLPAGLALLPFSEAQAKFLDYSSGNPAAFSSGNNGSHAGNGATINAPKASDGIGTSSCITINCPSSVTINTSNMGTLGDCAGQFEWNHPVPSSTCGVVSYLV
ncbi:MAG: hypothetical protein KF734_22175, partial [Saprospiraceae bacterium]|nr:hypothetical protein [Saprospiraceae bacterium]